MKEHYEQAAEEYRRALELTPPHSDGVSSALQRKLALAQHAASAALGSLPTPAELAARDVLLPAPLPRDWLPSAPPVQVERTLRKNAARVVERGSAVAMKGFWAVARPLARALDGAPKDIWTDWDEKGRFAGLFELSFIREQLEHNNLRHPYPDHTLTAFHDRGILPPAGVERFRTPDGSYNALSNPREGSTYVRFPRDIPARGLGEALPLDEPNPALVSHELLTRHDGMKEVECLNLLAAAWIQFMVHDWVNHRNYVSDPNEPEQSHAIELPEAHPANRLYHQRWMAFGRTMPDPTRRRDEQHLPPTALNTVTSWWDGSQVYGSDPETARKLRSGEDGKLKLSENGLLPLDGEQELAGNTNNWWVGLSLLHTVFVREHNAICDELKQHYPDWDDARLYNVARLVNAAVMAKIHTLEWTPAVLPNATLKMALESNWYGLVESRLHRKKRRVRRRIKIRDSVLGGLVGNPIKKDGVPYGLSEEFTEVYRLHELLPDEIEVRTLEDSAHVTPIPLASTRHKNARSLLEQHELVNLLYSFGVQHPGQIVLNNYPRTLQQISIPGQAMFDVGAADILRARERGVPRYNDFRRGLGLTPISRFEDLTADHQQLRKLKAIYQNDVNRIDLHIGTRAETTRPRGFGFGETLFQVFILNASRRLQADRFFTDDYDAETYTQTGLDWVDAATLKSVLLRHYPELYRTGLANVNNAFEPWDFGTLDPKRHPLEYIDRPGPLGKLLEGLESVVERAGTHLRNAQVLGNELALELASIRQAASTVSRKNADLPGPLPNGSFGLPIVGETRAFLKDNGKFLQERFDRHGPIFKTHVAGHPTACLGGKEAYEKFLTSPALVRQMGSPVHVRMLFNPRSLSFRDGADHARMRAQLLDGFSPENLEPCLPSLNALITRYLARWESRHELEWVPELLTFSFACIDSVILGNDASRENTRLTRAFDALTSGVLASPFSLRFARAYRARFILEEHVAAVVEARRRQPRADVVSRLLAGGRHGRLTDAELRMELVHFFLAAAPLHSALSYHLLLLGQHPAVMQHARLEAEQLTPTDLLRIGRIHELTYIAQVCRESRRCARLVPNTFFAKVVAPFEHGGFHVPAGWRAVGLIGATQHEPSVGQPERFDPERFAEAVPPAYVAHGGKRDPHACTGEPFADLVLTLLTARLLQQFTWSVPQQDLTPRLGKVAPTPASGLRVNFRKYAPPRAER